ncbi:MAG: hypothetical protein HOP20_06100 [Sulfuriferula sp.]|nr:hypothetical protein [Sulfuriferula sp.]
MNKVLIRILGKTLILPFRVQLAQIGGAYKPYLRILDTAELARFNLRGLTPEMFCVNIADQVNMRGLLSGVVENEQQIAVARWLIDADEYQAALQIKPDHYYWQARLAQLDGYIASLDDEFIEFEMRAVVADYGVRLTVVTANIGDKIAPYLCYQFDTYRADEWQGIAPAEGFLATLRDHLAQMLHAIANAGVVLTAIIDETDYAGSAPC